MLERHGEGVGVAPVVGREGWGALNYPISVGLGRWFQKRSVNIEERAQRADRHVRTDVHTQRETQGRNARTIWAKRSLPHSNTCSPHTMDATSAMRALVRKHQLPTRTGRFCGEAEGERGRRRRKKERERAKQWGRQSRACGIRTAVVRNRALAARRAHN